jgi:hypothetical protein
MGRAAIRMNPHSVSMRIDDTVFGSSVLSVPRFLNFHSGLRVVRSVASTIGRDLNDTAEWFLAALAHR